ncbi:proteasome activator complex subunit 4-like [Coccinella septempunctata]|uniref:proteasome activator complex subunit 4-like n=1 Tax=Coccinella septempunctata TaxID=41139 RepID=UPI001D062A5F|nr:proteasome activator complex subunit 4-like [Coccinella septempunctata]
MEDDEALKKLALKLGFKPQKDIIYNRLLPYSDQIYEEASEELKIIKTNLLKSFLARELEPGFLLWSIRLVQYIKLYGYLFSKEDHIRLIKLYLEVLKIRKQDPICISKWCNTLNLLLKKKYLLSRDELQIDWKPLHDLFSKIQDDIKSGMYKHPASMENDILSVIISCRTYFPASDTQDMLNKYKPQMCPLDDSEMLLSISALDALLPTCVKAEEASISYDLWFPEFMTLWNSCRNDCAWENSMMSLISRLSANNIGYIDFEPYFPSMYARFIRSFHLPVHFKMRTSSKQYNLGMQSIAIWIISTLNHKTDTSFLYLEKLMHMIRSFLYSANSGRWTSRLKELLSKLSVQFAHRIYIERYRPKCWGKEVPEDFKLSDADIDRFVNILKPCLDTAMFSRRVSNDVNFALLYLSALRPNLVIPMILEKLYAALDSLTEPHRLLTTMSAAISVSRCLAEGAKNNYPEGPTHIIPLLIAILPGIDPNDFNKCVVTFQFIAQFTSMIPIIDSSEAANHYEDMTEEEHIMCEASAGFEDFIVQFIDKICVWIESCSLEFVRPEQQSGEQTAKGLIEVMAEKAMQSTICTVLGQCSPKIFMAALKKVFNFISNNILEVDVGGKLAALLCGCFTRVNAKETLKLFVPYLCNKINALLNENANAQKEEHLDGEILFNLVVLSEVVDGLNEILPYLDELMNVLNRTLHMSSLRASKIGVNMLTNIITTLTSITPLERRSSNKSYSLHVKDFLSVREWAHPYEANELKVNWYVPGKFELENVQLLINTYLIPELDKLNDYSCGKITLSRPQLRNSLKIINAMMSAHLYLPMWDEPLVHLRKTQAEISRFEIVELKSHSLTMPDGSNVRKAVADTLHVVQKKLLEIDEGDTKSSNLIANIFVVLLLNEQQFSDSEKTWKHFTFMKKISQSPVIFRKRHTRTILIDRANLQQQIRTTSNRSALFTPTHQQILNDLFEQGVSSYRDMRLYGQSKLFLILGYFPYSYTLLTQKLKAILQMNTIDHHSKYKGCLYILLGVKNFPLIARRDWKFISEIWPSLVTSMPSEKLSIINLITQISESVSSSFQTTNIDSQFSDKIVDNVREIFGVSETAVEEESSKRLQEIQDQKRSDYKNCINSLLKACIENDLHWRFHLLAIGFLRDIVHLDVKYDRFVVKYFLDALINESILVRKIAIKVVLYILIQNKLKFKKTEIDPFQFSNSKKNGPLPPGYRRDNEWLLYNSNDLPKSSKEWNELKYVNDSCSGYYMWPDKLEVYCSPEEQPNLIDCPEEMNEEQKEIYSFFTNEENMSKLMYYFSLEDKKGADHFNPNRASIFKYLAKLFQDKILDMVLPHVEKFASNKLESHQRCAAEIVSGMIRGSKHWTFEKTEKLWHNIIPVLQNAIQNILTETLQDWSMCICLSLRSRDSRRYHWLMEFLLDDPLADPTSLIASTKLHLFMNTLFMQPWRNCDLYNRLMDYLKKHMTHPFQLIRIKISTALKIIFLSDYVPPGGVQDKNPKVSKFFDEYMPVLEWLYYDTLKKIDNNQNCDELLPTIKDIKREDALKLFKIVSKFITSFLVCRLNLSVPMEFYRTLPVTCVLQSNDVDDEIQPMCLNMLALLAQNLVVVDDVPEIIRIIETVIACPLWTARGVLAEFLSSFVFHNMAIISSREEWITQIKSFVMTLLEDPQPEVRQNACKFLSGLLHCNFLPSQSELLDDFKLKAKTKLKKSKLRSSAGSVNTSHLIKRHSGILGLCAFISATPYDIPEYLPDIFGVLGPHLNDPPPIPDTIKKTICDFKRTHQDNWEIHKTQFTEDQLLIFQDLTVPPSYYV